MKIAVVIPCYKVKKHILDVVGRVPDVVTKIYVVDDCCPQGSGAYVSKNTNDKRIEVLNHKQNYGVGAAVITGYKKAFNDEFDIIVKVDGDGQMPLNYIKSLISPIIENKVGYTKGNRFYDFEALKQMPRIRLFGNSVLAFVIKAVSGYWSVMDPNNGFTAISRETIKKLSLKTIDKRYFFEISMLVNLNIKRVLIKDIPMPAIYGQENSNLNISIVLLTFPYKIFKIFIKRIFFSYYIYDFNIASVYLILGVPSFIFGILFGAYHWIQNGLIGQLTPTGTIMASILFIVLGFQLLLQAISIDIANNCKLCNSFD